jgi:hypothetical protein
MIVPCQKDMDLMNGGWVISTKNCDLALNLKCVPRSPLIGDGLNAWKVVKNMKFESVTSCVMAYVCPKSYAKNLGVFLSYHQDCINILIYNNYCIDYIHTLYICNKIFCVLQTLACLDIHQNYVHTKDKQERIAFFWPYME